MKVIFSVLSLLIISMTCSAEDIKTAAPENYLSVENEPYFNVLFGLSPFSGILGFEYQERNNAYGIGLPGRISYRYYFKPYQDTKFWGVYLGKYSLDGGESNKTYSFKGVNYSNVDRTYIGAGVGYRWQWPSGWNTSVSIALEYSDDDYSNPATGQFAADSGVFPFPGINAGYKF